MKRNRPKLLEHQPTVDLPAEPDWADITERVRQAKDRELITLGRDSKITGDVTEALKRGVRIRLDENKLWVLPEQRAAFRMSWEVLI